HRRRALRRVAGLLARRDPDRALPSPVRRWTRSSAARVPLAASQAALQPQPRPAMTDRLIINATLVNEGRRQEADLRIREGRIERIDRNLSARAGEAVFDAAGAWLMPGVIDDQVHFREPGLEHKADIASESRACLAGGITSYMEMPNTRPPAVTREAIEDKYRRGAASSRVNFAFYFGATNDNIDEIRAIDPAAVPGLKVFMGASTGN